MKPVLHKYGFEYRDKYYSLCDSFKPKKSEKLTPFREKVKCKRCLSILHSHDKQREQLAKEVL